MSLKIAFAGFRHGHIFSLLERAMAAADVRVVAACEEDAATRAALVEMGAVDITHDNIDRMLAGCDCDIVAIGDYYTVRGSIALRAMRRGRHVIGDKPLCTSLAELDEIETLSRERDLKVGCMLDLRDAAPFVELRRLVCAGTIGEVHAVQFGGQHPLLPGQRPAWYFEPGKHGGTINDIAIHAMDLIPWITGERFTMVDAARCWNAFAPRYPHFRDAAQVMLTMSNGCGVIGDVSYFAPDSQGYSSPFYWRTTVWGRAGVAEVSASRQRVVLALNGAAATEERPVGEGNAGGYLRAFLADVRGAPCGDGPTTASVLRATRVALTAQAAGDSGQTRVPLPA